jgi:hypothetical protein
MCRQGRYYCGMIGQFLSRIAELPRSVRPRVRIKAPHSKAPPRMVHRWFRRAIEWLLTGGDRLRISFQEADPV